MGADCQDVLVLRLAKRLGESVEGFGIFYFYFYVFFLSTLALRSAAANWFVILSFVFPETRGEGTCGTSCTYT